MKVSSVVISSYPLSNKCYPSQNNIKSITVGTIKMITFQVGNHMLDSVRIRVQGAHLQTHSWKTTILVTHKRFCEGLKVTRFQIRLSIFIRNF